MPNTYRRLLVDAIEANGGYSRYLDGSWALSWNVAVYELIPDFDTLLPKVLAANEQGLTPETPFDAELLAAMKEDWNSEHTQESLWYGIIEDMTSNVRDDDTYRTVRPEIAHRYGLLYERFPRKYKRIESERAYYSAGLPGWQCEDPYVVPYFDVRWEFHGRSGKHLVLNKFEGRLLNGRDLAVVILEDDNGSYPNTWCQNLLAFISECDLCFTRENIKSEFEYQLAWRFGQDLEIVAIQTEKLRKEAVEVQFWAERDVVTARI